MQVKELISVRKTSTDIFSLFGINLCYLSSHVCLRQRALNNNVEIDRGILGHVYDYIALENRI